MKINDPAAVARQYASESNLEARRSLYEHTDGPDPREMAFRAVAEAQPVRVLEVGGGPGELAARIAGELDCEVVMIDVSPRVGDVQELPFEDASFDVAVAAWMLFHVPDLDRGLTELARVLRPGGRLVAVTNAMHHLQELRDLAGAAMWERVFRSEDGRATLEAHFASVERRDADGCITIEDEQVIRDFVASMQHDAELDLGPIELPLRVRRASSVFIAEKAP